MDFREPYEILVKRLSNWIEVTIDYLPSVVVAFAVFMVFYTIAKWGAKFFQRYIGSHMESRTLAGLYTFFFKILVILVGLYCAVEILDFNELVISMLAGAGILGLVLGLAFQELITNLISGISLTVKKYFHLGDLIKIHDFTGTVEMLGLRATILRGLDGETIIIPNKDVLQTVVTDYDTSGKMKKHFFIGVPYTEDVSKISDILKEAISGLNFLHKDNQTEVLLFDVSGSIMKLELTFWVLSPNRKMAFREEDHWSILSIKTAFERYQMPLPVYIRNTEFKQVTILKPDSKGF